MRKAQLLGVVVTLMVVGGVAEAGGHVKPKWCPEHTSSGSFSELNGSDVRGQLRAVVGYLCDPEHVGEPDPWAATDAAYKQLSTRFGLTDNDWADVGAWVVATERMNPDAKQPDSKKPWSQLTPVEQYVSVEHNGVGAGNHYGSTDPEYFVDALGTKLTETGRTGWLEQCLTTEGARGHEVLWALCQADIEMWDPKKAMAEIKSDTAAAPEDRMIVRLAVEDVKQRIAKHAGEMKKLLASDPVYGQMVDIVKKAHSDWAARSTSPSPALAMIATMEDALVTNSRRAQDGCHEKTWSVLKPVISKIPAKQFEVLHQDKEYGVEYMRRLRDQVAEILLNDTDGYAASAAYTMCWLVEPRIDEHTVRPDDFASTIEGLAARWPGYRGPRTTAWTNIMKAGLKPDDRDARIEFPDVQRPFFGDTNGSFSGSSGTVTKATAKGDKIHFEFKKHKVKWLQQYGCHNTNHIRGVMSNGEFDYEYVCEGAKEKTADEGPDPYDVSKETGANVKVGQAIAAFGDQVFAAWKDSTATVPQLVLGQPVK